MEAAMEEAASLSEVIRTEMSDGHLFIPSVVARSARGVELIGITYPLHDARFSLRFHLPTTLAGSPVALPDLTECIKMTLRSAQLTRLPCITTAPNLTHLDLSRNVLKTLPNDSTWAALVALEELDLSHNQIKELTLQTWGPCPCH